MAAAGLRIYSHIYKTKERSSALFLCLYDTFTSNLLSFNFQDFEFHLPAWSLYDDSVSSFMPDECFADRGFIW